MKRVTTRSASAAKRSRQEAEAGQGSRLTAVREEEEPIAGASGVNTRHLVTGNGTRPDEGDTKPVPVIDLSSDTSSGSDDADTSSDDVMCKICLEAFDEEQIIKMTNCCELSVCEDCLVMHMDTRINQQSRLNCPGEECSEQIPVDLSKKYLSHEMWEKHAQWLLEKAIENLEDVDYLFKCPQCKNISQRKHDPMNDSGMDILMGTCVWCRFTYCTNCLAEYHGSYDCETTTEERRRLLTADVEEARRILEEAQQRRQQEDAASQEVIQRQFRRCPNPKCRADIEKISGCNHMRCKCGTEFCYGCGQVMQYGGALHVCPLPQQGLQPPLPQPHHLEQRLRPEDVVHF